MTYFTADTYKNYKRVGDPFTKNNKLYTKVECKCDRCSKGIYVIGVNNGQIVPHSAYGGICLKCNGKGILQKEVRLYTESEYNKMQKNNEIAKQRRAEAREKEMKESFEKNKVEWLEKNGFSTDGYTYIVTGDSFSIKDELKAAGFKYDHVLRWHRSTPEGYEDKIIKVKLEDVIEISAWGQGHYIEGAYDKIDHLINMSSPAPKSEWIGEVGKKINPIVVTLNKKSSFMGQFGLTNVFTFKDENECIYTWFTSTEKDIETGDKLTLEGTVKKHDEYKGVKTTILTRCKITKVE